MERQFKQEISQIPVHCIMNFSLYFSSAHHTALGVILELQQLEGPLEQQKKQWGRKTQAH